MPDLDISQVDLLFADGSYPIEMLLYYPHGLDSRNIREALKFLSPVFWPLFGEYVHGVISHAGYSEQNCFNEERHQGEFADLGLFVT